jgi:hypothetical protein
MSIQRSGQTYTSMIVSNPAPFGLSEDDPDDRRFIAVARSAKTSFDLILQLADENAAILDDPVLEEDRRAFLRFCAKTWEKQLNAVTSFANSFRGREVTFSQSCKIFSTFYKRSAQNLEDIACGSLDYTIKKHRRDKIGPEYDNQFRDMQAKAAEGDRAIKELQGLHALIRTTHAAPEYRVEDVRIATGLKHRQLVTYHLEKLAARGRISPKESKLGDWRLSREDFNTAVGYITGRPQTRATKK